MTLQWFGKMNACYSADLIMKSLIGCNIDFGQLTLSSPPNGKPSLMMPIVPSQSLYKSDPKRSNPASRVFTRQHEINRIVDQLGQLQELDLFSSFSSDTESIPGSDSVVNWSSLPRDVHPMGGELPPDRVEKKCHQLENMTSAVLKLAKDGDIVVDFCSGGGHLGIVIAYMLQSATVILVSKFYSM